MRRSPTRTTPSARSGPALELVDAVRALGPGLQARAGVLTGRGRGHPRRRRTRAWSRATSSTPRRGSSRWPRPAPCSSARRPSARRRSAIAFEPAGEQVLKGKASPVPAWRALRVVAERGGRGARRRARGAVRRPRRRAAPAQGPVPRHRPRAAGAPRVGHRAGGHRQEPPRLGVPQVRRRRRRAGAGGTRAAPRRTARGSRSGRWARWSARGPGSSRATTRPPTRAGIAATLAEHVPDEAERRWIEPALLALLGVGEPPAGGAEELFAAWRTFFERLAATGAVVLLFEDLHWADAGTARLHRPPARVEPRPPDPRSSRSPGRSCSTGGPTGAPAGAPSSRCDLEPLAEPAMRELLAGLVPGLPEPRRRARSWRAPTASRCTPSRRSGCSSPTAGSSSARRAAIEPVGDLAEPRGPGDAARAHRGAPRRARPGGPAPCSRTPPCWASRSRSAALAAIAGGENPDVLVAARPARPARAAARRGGPALAGARPVRVRPGAHPRGRLQHARRARPAGAAPRRRALLRVARRRRAGRGAGRPLPRGLRQRPRARRPTRSPARRGSRSRPLRTGRWRWARCCRRSRS